MKRGARIVGRTVIAIAAYFALCLAAFALMFALMIAIGLVALALDWLGLVNLPRG